MGNQQPITIRDNKSKKHKNRYDNFIIEFSHSYHSKLSQITDIKLLDDRRTVFVSLIGLFQTYKNCPAHILYSAVFVLPIKRDWIYNIQKYIDKDEEFPLDIFTKLSIFNSATETQKLIELLQWKDSQKLLFCMLDEHNNSNPESLVHPFWRYFSNALTKLYDTKTGNQCKPLNLNDKCWENGYESKYNTKTSSILSELYFLTMKYKTIKEIIYASNPFSLNPISFYGENADHFTKCEMNTINKVNKNEGDWFLSVDYFD